LSDTAKRNQAILISNQSPLIIPRPDHCISRKNICPNALKVLYRLKDGGYQAHIVGGGVRDLLLGLQPKDFDVATDATPEQVKKLFRNCRLIGRRFRLAHIHFGRTTIEVATFRGLGGESHPDRKLENGQVIFDNVYGTIEEDALRRDFSVNAMYYDIRDFSIRDYAGGYRDLSDRTLRLIGDPEERYREDPVRLIRAVRFAAKLGLTIEPATEAPLRTMGGLLGGIPPARLFEEVLKLFMGGYASECFRLLNHYGLYTQLFPDSGAMLESEAGVGAKRMIEAALENTDQRVAKGKPVTPAFLFATMLWPAMHSRALDLEKEGLRPYDALHQAADWVIGRQVSRTAIPRRFSTPMREIWVLQSRFSRTQGKRVKRLMAHPRFRAAYDFLLLRAVEDNELETSAKWWTRAQELSPGELSKLIYPQSSGGGQHRRRKRPRAPAGQQPA
jgi:poly(A) polymerase